MAQAKRIQQNTDSKGVNGTVAVSLEAPIDPREEINFHNIWGSLSCEPVDADANAQGNWVLFILRENTTSPAFTDAIIDAELSNAIIIACGVWGASNQTPYNISIHPSTSRTLQAGDKLNLQVVPTGISGGMVSIKVMLCAHTTRK